MFLAATPLDEIQSVYGMVASWQPVILTARIHENIETLRSLIEKDNWQFSIHHPGKVGQRLLKRLEYHTVSLST